MPPKAQKKKFVPLAQATLNSTASSASASASLKAVDEDFSDRRKSPVRALAPHAAALKAAEEAQKHGHFHNDDHCFICTDPISWYAVGECNHRVCHLCSLRLRALLKDNNCSMCKTALSNVIFTGDGEKPFNEFVLNRMAKVDRKLSIHFDTDQAYDDVMILLRFNCPDPECDVACPSGWPELKKHVRSAHNKYLCDLCTRHKKLFTHEHTMYTQSDLDKHFKTGDANDPSFKGHPKCGFCNVHFYGDDELYEHCRKQHEQCFLCTGVGIRHQYYEDYNRLEQHFRKEHFCCMDPECLEKKFQVFFSDIDLKAHEMQVHPTKRTARGKGQKIDINFSIAGSPSLDLGSRATGGSSGAGGGRNRGRNNNRRGEAPQRDAGDMSEQFGEPRIGSGIRPPPGFGQLSREVDEPTPAEATNLAGGSSLNLRPESSSNLVGIAGSRYSNSVLQGFDSSDMNFPPPQRAITPKPSSGAFASAVSSSSQSNAVAVGMMDPAILAILQELFQSDKTKLEELKSIAKMYRSDLTTCSEFLNFFIRLVFDGRSGATEAIKKDKFIKSGRVWKSLADSIPDTESGELYPKVGKKSKKQSKQAEMLKVWNDYRIKNNFDYSSPYNESSYANPVAGSSRGSFPPPSLNGGNRNNVGQQSSSPNQSARVLVIKSKASHQRNTPMWNAMSKGKGFVSSLEDTNAKRPIFDTMSNSSRSSSVGPEFREGLSSASTAFAQSSEPTPSQIQAALLWSGNAAASSLSPAASSSAYSKSKPSTPAVAGDFPGLPSRPVAVAPLARKGSNINDWESSNSQGYEQQQQQQQQPQQGGKKKKKEKIVLMSIGL
ncbi:UNVERIFIED_CONTAM: hypothetical protein HDU68_010505 [Siphonaria sp. JEL0065]|nr:hypothetical protein HDU68_010505 [Siphonaria sp. JEL0065]